jgi:hypothetical protein
MCLRQALFIMQNQVKHLLLLIFFVSYSYCSFGQHASSFSFIGDAIRSKIGIGKIVYLDTSIRFYQPFHLFIKKSYAVGHIGQTEVKMKFKKAEINSIDEAFKKTKAVKWEDSLFQNSVRITEDTLLLLGKNADSRKYFKKHFGNKYFFISQPVFARNGTVAIFRLSEMEEPSSGFDFLFIYVKQQKNWEQKMLIHSGAW